MNDWLRNGSHIKAGEGMGRHWIGARSLQRRVACRWRGLSCAVTYSSRILATTVFGRDIGRVGVFDELLISLFIPCACVRCNIFLISRQVPPLTTRDPAVVGYVTSIPILIRMLEIGHSVNQISVFASPSLLPLPLLLLQRHYLTSTLSVVTSCDRRALILRFEALGIAAHYPA